jgi:uncharacterized protein
MKRLFTFLLLAPVAFSLTAQDGFLWKISGNGLKKDSYLYGTIHVICEEDVVIQDNLAVVFEQIDKLFLELDLSDPGIMQTLMAKSIDPGMVEIYSEFDPEIATQIDIILNETMGMGFDQMKMMKPFVLMGILAQAFFECVAKTSYEAVFMKMAKEQDRQIAIKGLETVDFQLSLFDSIPLEEQLESLREIVRDREESRVFMENMARLYKQQDLTGLYKLIEKEDTFAEFSEELLTKRNIAWIPVIEKSMKSGSCLFAVGAGHLPGENGVIELLRAKGYKVEAY